MLYPGPLTKGRGRQASPQPPFNFTYVTSPDHLHLRTKCRTVLCPQGLSHPLSTLILYPACCWLTTPAPKNMRLSCVVSVLGFSSFKDAVFSRVRASSPRAVLARVTALSFTCLEGLGCKESLLCSFCSCQKSKKHVCGTVPSRFIDSGVMETLKHVSVPSEMFSE